MKKVRVDELIIDGTTYVPKEAFKLAGELDGLPYVMIRTYSAGVHCGYLKERRENQEIVLMNAIRIWEWDGAASLSQLAMEGVKDTVEVLSNCKFGMPVSHQELVWIEIIKMTEQAKESIQNVPSWKK